MTSVGVVVNCYERTYRKVLALVSSVKSSRRTGSRSTR